MLLVVGLAVPSAVDAVGQLALNFVGVVELVDMEPESFSLCPKDLESKLDVFSDKIITHFDNKIKEMEMEITNRETLTNKFEEIVCNYFLFSEFRVQISKIWETVWKRITRLPIGTIRYRLTRSRSRFLIFIVNNYNISLLLL